MQKRWMGAVVLAGALVAAGCGRGDDTAQVTAGGSGDVAAQLEASFASTLGRPYEVSGTTVFSDDTGARVDFPSSAANTACLGAMGGASARLQVDDANHLIVFFEAGDGPARAIVDTGEQVAYLSRDGFSDPSIVSAPWVRLRLDDASAAATAVPLLGFGLSLFSLTDMMTPASNLDLVRRSTASAVEVGQEEVDGVATTHVVATLDRDRFDRAEREQTRRLNESMKLPGLTPGSAPDTPPGTATPATEVPTVDVWIDGDGHLRRVTLSAAISRGAPTDPTSNRKATTFAMTYDFRDAGAPLATGIPAAGDTADLGSQPAAVLKPKPDCDIFSTGIASAGLPTTPEIEAWQACIRAHRDENFAGKTVDEYVAAGGTAYGVTGAASDGPSGFPMLDACPLPSFAGVPLPDPPGQPGLPDQPVLSLVPDSVAGTIPGPP